MKMNDDFDKDIDADDEEEGGSSGSTGEIIEFRYKDTLSSEPRDDLLSPEETRRLLIVHKELHKERVDKQKATRREREALKEGKNTLSAIAYDRKNQYGYGGGDFSPYKTHPITNHAQFSGATDRKVIGVPGESLSQTNDDLKEQLENKLENRLENKNELRMRQAPTFNPKPRPY